jgi:hypothetical protein
MSVRNGIVPLLALSALTILVGCGSSSNNVVAVPPPSGGFSNSNLSGTYVFSVSGYDLDGVPLAILGTVIANGSGGNGRGGITGGTIDIVVPDSGFTTTAVFDLAVNPNGFYTVGVDGRGQFTIGTATANPFDTNLTFDFVLQDSSHGLITEFDGNGSGSGTLDLQTSLAQIPAGPYAFSFAGSDGNGNALLTVGDFSLDANGSILTGDEDLVDANFASAPTVPTGTVTLGPSTTPATLLNTALGALAFDVYAIDSTHLKFIETDGAEFLSGDAFSQPSTTISGTMAFTLVGLYAGLPAAAGGYMVTDNGTILPTSSEDVNDDGTVPALISTFSAAYAPAGTGRYLFDDFSGFFGGTEYAAYPFSGGVFLLEIDDAGNMSGAAYPQTSTTLTSAQGYALNLSGDNLSDETEVDDIAEFTADSSSTTCDKAGDILCGLIDENYLGAGNAQFYDQVLAGDYQAIDGLGRYGIAANAGTSTNPGTLNGGFGLTLYTVDGTTFPCIETDAGQIATGVAILQNSANASPGARPHMFVPHTPMRPHVVHPKLNLKKKN